MTTHDRPLSAASSAYLAAVGAALAGVPDSDRQELLDDLAEHLGELGHESDTGLIERLGTPEQYAAELLASAGIEPAARAGRARLELTERIRTAAALFDSPGLRRMRAFTIDLRPGWWVARGWLVLAAIAARSGLQDALWLPNVTAKPVVDFALLVGAVVVSVRIGRGPKWAAWIATGLGIVALVSVLSADRSYFYRVYDQQSPVVPGVLIEPNGNQVTNIFPFDAAGKPTHVFLFDQDGNLLDIGNDEALRNAGVPFISGVFPQLQLTTDNQGRTRGVPQRPPRVSIQQLPQSGTTPTTTKKTANTVTPLGATATTAPTSVP